MWKVMCIGTLLLVCLRAHADNCALPSADSGEPYATLADLPRGELRLMLSEYMFMHRWTRHSEAIAAGFRRGDRVYGEVLRNDGKFSAKNTAVWRLAYEKSERRQFLNHLGAKVDMGTVDRMVVEWTLGVCLGNGIWSRMEVIDDCRFAFRAGLLPDDASRVVVQPLRFEVRGGRCQRWPRRPLSIKGDLVQCVRSGDGPVAVELKTDPGGLTQQTLLPLPPKMLPEPAQERRLSDPVTEAISLSRSRDYRLRQLGQGCPTCALYAADIHPSDPEAVILRATTVSSSGSGWQPCPAGLRCGVYEFSPPDNPVVSGCSGLPVCRVWRLAESGAEASDVIQLTYQRSEMACVNCPAGVDFPTAYSQWQEARDRAPARCELVTDSPAQAIGAVPKN